MGVDSKKVVENLNSDTILTAFLDGLNESTHTVVKNCNFVKMKDAILKASEEEASLFKRKQNKPNSQEPLKSQFCGKIGHSADKCYKISLNKSTNNVRQKSISFSSNKNGPNKSSLSCSYCKKTRHHISDCFSCKAKESRKTSNNNREYREKSKEVQQQWLLGNGQSLY